MSSLSIPCSALGTPTSRADAEPSRWARLARAIVGEYRIRRALKEVWALDDRSLRDIGLCRCGIDHAARFGRN